MLTNESAFLQFRKVSFLILTETRTHKHTHTMYICAHQIFSSCESISFTCIQITIFLGKFISWKRFIFSTNLLRISLNKCKNRGKSIEQFRGDWGIGIYNYEIAILMEPMQLRCNIQQTARIPRNIYGGKQFLIMSNPLWCVSRMCETVYSMLRHVYWREYKEKRTKTRKSFFFRCLKRTGNSATNTAKLICYGIAFILANFKGIRDYLIIIEWFRFSIYCNFIRLLEGNDTVG